MSPRKPSYLPSPTISPDLMPRLAAIVEVMAGSKSVSQAARSLGLSRNHFQTILHRGILGLTSAIEVKAGGRPAKPNEIAVLQKELKRLERENARLKRQVGSTEQLLQVASGLLQGRLRPTGRQRRTKSASGASGERATESEPDARHGRLLAGVAEMKALGVKEQACAVIAGVDRSTLWRWRRCSREPCWPASSSGRSGPRPSLDSAREAESLIRHLHGLVGAAALSHSIAGLSRRAAAAIKRDTLTAMERERKRSLVKIRVTTPGILRGLDAMYIDAAGTRAYALIAADGAVAYRTSCTLGVHYDEALVARALRADFECHGAPLVLRLDRASCHLTANVTALLKEHEVLPLHGPPHCPRYYGQLERQNREHRAFLNKLGTTSSEMLEPCLAEMLEAVNRLWRRRSLNWHTASELWNARPRPTIDRTAFHQEVHDRARCIARRIPPGRHPADLAERLAIEQTLEQHGYLRRELGGWC